MFYLLLVVTLLVSAGISFAVTRFFGKSIGHILDKLVGDELAFVWRQYLVFAVMVVGVSGGVRLWELEKYTATKSDSAPVDLTAARWTLEIYRTGIETLQSVAWVMLLFFLAALIGMVIKRAYEARINAKDSSGE